MIDLRASHLGHITIITLGLYCVAIGGHSKGNTEGKHDVLGEYTNGILSQPQNGQSEALITATQSASRSKILQEDRAAEAKRNGSTATTASFCVQDRKCRCPSLPQKGTLFELSCACHSFVSFVFREDHDTARSKGAVCQGMLGRQFVDVS